MRVRTNTNNFYPSTETTGNGILEIWIDGTSAYSRDNIKYIADDSVKISSVWADVYYGGAGYPNDPSKVYLDNIKAESAYIGAKATASEHTINPEGFFLAQNSPNPFNPETTITYTLPEDSPVVVGIYNLAGQEVRRLTNQISLAGTHHVTWDGRDDMGLKAASGIYLYRVRAGMFEETKKMVLIE